MLSVRLADLGRPKKALAASQEAVTIRRELAAARPDAFRPDLATALNNLSNRLADLGRPEEALAANGRRRESTGNWPLGGPMPTATSWNSRCELLPGLSTAKTSAMNLLKSPRSDNGPLSLLRSSSFCGPRGTTER